MPDSDLNVERVLEHWTVADTFEGSLRFPGAVLLEVRGADEGEGTGFDGLDASAYTQTYFRASTTWTAVVDWHEQLLLPRGWKVATSLERGPDLEWRAYVRPPREEFWVKRLDPGKRLWAPHGAFDRPGLVYSIVYKIQSPGPTAGE